MDWPKYDDFLHGLYTRNGPKYESRDGTVRISLRCLLHGRTEKRSKVDITQRERRKAARRPIACPKTIAQYILPDGTVVFEPKSEDSHNHLLEESEKAYKPRGLKMAAAKMTAHGFSPADIFRALTGHFGKFEEVETLLVAAGGKWFSRQDVKNAGKAFRTANPDPRLVGHDFVESVQMDEVVRYLGSLTTAKEVWYYKSILVEARELDGLSSPGLVFASSTQLDILRKYLLSRLQTTLFIY